MHNLNASMHVLLFYSHKVIRDAKIKSFMQMSDTSRLLAPSRSYWLYNEDSSSTFFLLVELVQMYLVRKKCQMALRLGCVPSPTARLILLGDAATGKTSTFNHLLGKPHPSQHDPTEGVEASRTDWTEVSSSWKEVPWVERLGRCAVDQALAMFCLHKHNKLQSDYLTYRALWPILHFSSVILYFLTTYLSLIGLLPDNRIIHEIFGSLTLLQAMPPASLIGPWASWPISLTSLTFLAKFQMPTFDMTWFVQDFIQNFLLLIYILAGGFVVGCTMNFLLTFCSSIDAFAFFILSVPLVGPDVGLNNSYGFMYTVAVMYFLYSSERKRKVFFSNSSNQFNLWKIDQMFVCFVVCLLPILQLTDRYMIRFLPWSLGAILGLMCCHHLCQTNWERHLRSGWDIIADFFLSYLIALYSMYNIDVIGFKCFLFLNPLLVTVYTCVEYLHWRLTKVRELPLNRLRSLMQEDSGKWPVRLRCLTVVVNESTMLSNTCT